MHGRRSVSVIVPTYQEMKNLPILVERLELLIVQQGLDIELLIMDDDSRDGSVELIQELNKPWIRFFTRTGERGLSLAVLEGIHHALHDDMVVMDADMSHPPESIPKLLEALDRGHDFVIGSRYVEGASTDNKWGLLRWLNSKVATWLAYPLVAVKDPMSGFFAFNKEILRNASCFNPIGYKIGLELLLKCNCRNVCELPIHFYDRQHGESKLSLKQQLQYIQHLRRLYIFKYAEQSHAAQFFIVGGTGVITNLMILTLLLWAKVLPTVAVGVAIIGSMVGNFCLNRRFTFSYARKQSVSKQFLGFVTTCSMGALVNYCVTMGLIGFVMLFGRYPQLAAIIGVLSGTGLNYVMNRYLVFSKVEITEG